MSKGGIEQKLGLATCACVCFSSLLLGVGCFLLVVSGLSYWSSPSSCSCYCSCCRCCCPFPWCCCCGGLLICSIELWIWCTSRVFVHVAPCRVLSRPWSTDPFLKNICHEFIEKKDSITKVIQFRPGIKDMYTENRLKVVEDYVISQKIRDFAFAPHRYHTEARVLVRLVLTFDATLTTAAQVILLRGRTSPEGASCAQTLSMLNEEVLSISKQRPMSSENLVQITSGRAREREITCNNYVGFREELRFPPGPSVAPWVVASVWGRGGLATRHDGRHGARE